MLGRPCLQPGAALHAWTIARSLIKAALIIVVIFVVVTALSMGSVELYAMYLTRAMRRASSFARAAVDSTKTSPADKMKALRSTRSANGGSIGAVADSVIARADELTALDAAIGDGDHGANMKRGFEAVLQDLDALSVMNLPELLKAVGMKLVAKVGGASGPLYGTLFLALGKELPDAPSRPAAAAAFGRRRSPRSRRAARATSVRRRCSTSWFRLSKPLQPAGMRRSVREAALLAAERTIPMRATRGRASFLGERSVGHMDPGARSASLMIGAVCDEFEGQ